MEALSRRNLIVGDGLCVHCGEVIENGDHIFTACRLAHGVWCGIVAWLNIPPMFDFSLKDVMQVIDYMDGSTKKKEIVYGILILACWRIWNARNKKVFSNGDLNVVRIVADVKSMGFLWYRCRAKGNVIDWKGWCSSSWS
ncbi:uncharacterized protein LOC110882588 [Helianthus annuus]|uniref:uncharacterized protein LOC110882588 n=1 Tax=Helianthus annuus TaxID=4232 RepID=UPI000B8F9ACE|nr:uncharacterized protein LOC110882588 [Helianthus annuus]